MIGSVPSPSLAAQTTDAVDLKGGSLINSACLLREPVEEQYFQYEHNTHCTALHCTVLARRIMVLNVPMIIVQHLSLYKGGHPFLSLYYSLLFSVWGAHLCKQPVNKAVFWIYK